MINQLISSIIECEKALENIRIELNQQSLFSLKPIMERFDQQNKGHITSYDILQFCQDNDVECNAFDAFLCVKYFDVNKDGRVTFDDLTIQLLSKTNPQIRFTAAIREPYFIEKQMCLPEMIEIGVSYFFGELLIYLREQLELKQNLNKENFNYFTLFQQLDRSNNGIIKMNDFQKHFNLSMEDCSYFYMMHNYNQEIDQINLLDIFALNVQSTIQQQKITDKSSPSPLKQNNYQAMSYSGGEDLFVSPEPRATVKMQKANLKLDQSNASSIFVDELAQKLMDVTLTPRKNENLYYPQIIDYNQQTYVAFFQLLSKCKQLSKTQQKLLQRNDFSIKLLFAAFIQEDENQLCEQDFINGFKRLRIQLKGSIRDLLIHQCNNQLMNYDQFRELFLNNNIEEKVMDNEIKLFSSVTLDYIRQLFQDHIDIANFKTVNIRKLVKQTSEMINNTEQLQLLFKKYNAYPTEKEIELLNQQLQFLQI